MSKYFDNKCHREYQLDEQVPHNLSVAIVIPVYNEPNIGGTLESLGACSKPRGTVEVIIVINSSMEDMPDVHLQNEQAHRDILAASDRLPRWLRILVIDANGLPPRRAGVGFARKIGMDEAARRIFETGRESVVPIVCLDADCRVATSYLIVLEDFFNANTRVEGVSINFEHRTADAGFAEAVAINRYELHLRYMIQAQRWAGYPFAFQTVGSAMAVRASTYVLVGGMNNRKAGEDFYFLHKVIERGRFADITGTSVHPAGRRSDRVPFGTGRAVGRILDGEEFRTYSPRSYQELKGFIARVPGMYDKTFSDIEGHLGDAMEVFLRQSAFVESLDEIRRNTSSQRSFVKRLFRWFNAFRLMKFMHFARDNFYPDVEVLEAANWVLTRYDRHPVRSEDQALVVFRELAQSGYKVDL